MNPIPLELKNYMEKRYPNGKYHSVYEAGFCGFWIHRQLENYGFNNIIVSPTDIPTSGKERLTKTDEVDSRKLARGLSSGTIDGIYIPSILHQELRSLSRQRHQQMKKLVRIKNQIKSYVDFYGHILPENSEMRHWTKRFIEHLQNLEFEFDIGKEQLALYIDELLILRNRKLKILTSLKKYLKEYNMYNAIELLITVPGISFITATTFYTEIMDITRFTSTDKLASYIGLVPSISSTGEKVKVLGVSVQFNRYLRSLLVEASWVAVRNDPALTLAFNNYLIRMSKQEAIIRIARKLLNRIYCVLKNKTEYVYSVVA
jgi:transposase